MAMAKRIGIGLLCAVVGYFVGLFGSVFVQSLIGPHGPDSGMAAGLAGAAFFGPLLAVISFALGMGLSKPSAKPSNPTREPPL